MAKIDDSILMAYADGELSGVEEQRVAAEIEADPSLKAAYEKHLMLRGQIEIAFDSLADEPLPDAILDTLKNNPKDWQTQPHRPLFAFLQIQWLKPAFASAAVLAVAALFFLNTSPTIQEAQLNPTVAHTLSSAPDGSHTQDIQVIASYLDNDTLCRTYKSTDSKDGTPQENLACQASPQTWHLIASAPYIPKTAYRPAGESRTVSIKKLTATMRPLTAEELKAHLEP